MASYDDDTVTRDNSVSVSVIGVIEEAVFCEKQDRDEKPIVWDSESGGRVCFVDKVVGFNELEEEEDEEPRAETVRSLLACENDEVVDCDDVSKEFFFSDEAKEGVLEEEEEEERAIVGGDVFGANFAFGSSEKENSREIRILSEGLVGRFRDIEIESAEEVRVLESSEESRGNESERLDQSNGNEEEEEEVGLFDDWEGIERTELEKRFGEAMMFVGSKSNADRISSLDSDTKMQLYGLQKAAIEGPCCVPQPMALKVSARAKW